MSEIFEKLSFYHSLSVLCLAAGLLLLSAAASFVFPLEAPGSDPISVRTAGPGGDSPPGA